MDRCALRSRNNALINNLLFHRYMPVTKTFHVGARQQSTSVVHENYESRLPDSSNDIRTTNSTSPRGLARLPTSTLVRNLVLGKLFTTPLLFEPAFWTLRKIADTRSRLLNVDANPLLRALIKPLIYDQFCAGRDELEVVRTREKIRSIGYAGVILCYGREVTVDASNTLQPTGSSISKSDLEIAEWRDGNLKTLDMIGTGDWLGIKFTGAGQQVATALMQQRPPCATFLSAMDAICLKAKDRGCRVWIDAEQQVLQAAIDSWTIDLMRRYNGNGTALVYNTVQAYLKSSRDRLQRQLTLAGNEGWVLAIKLVRGAYIKNDDRAGIHNTKRDTDDSYNGIIRDMLTRSNLGEFEKGFPKTELFIAGHNPTSVAAAIDLVSILDKQGTLRTIPSFGQLQGMADEIGCKLLDDFERLKNQQSKHNEITVVPRAYKCLTWGSVQECMQYLVRRVVENKGGMDRMRDGLPAYQAELKRRLIG